MFNEEILTEQMGKAVEERQTEVTALVGWNIASPLVLPHTLKRTPCENL